MWGGWAVDHVPFPQYRECIQELNGGEQSRVRLPNIEYGYIRQLQQDNSDLRTLLEEHQAALEMIMTKYRQQVISSHSLWPYYIAPTRVSDQHLYEHWCSGRKSAGRPPIRGEHPPHPLLPSPLTPPQELQLRTDQVYNMASVMYQAARAEDATSQAVAERVAQLEFENKHLRDLLQFSTPQLVAPNDRSQPGSAPHKPHHTPTRNKLHSQPDSPAPVISNSVEHDGMSDTPLASESDSLDLQQAASSRPDSAR